MFHIRLNNQDLRLAESLMGIRCNFKLLFALETEMPGPLDQ